MPGAAHARALLPDARLRRWLLATVLVFLAWLAYCNAFSAPFLFDDHASIESNATIQRLTDIGAVLNPPAVGSGVTGRPLVNLSLAVNYAWGGTAVGSYHILNWAVHVAAGLMLFGLIRRTLELPVWREKYSGSALPLAWTIAALWTLHPLQSESVTCVIQRTEVLVGFFLLTTLYGFVRSVESPGQVRWQILAVGACLSGMASKEVMVTAPLLVLLYDRTFISGSFRAALRERRRLHADLAATWLLLAWLVAHNGGTRGSVAGLGLGVSPLDYALKQCEAIALYLKLALWPHPLLVDYGESLTVAPARLALCGPLVLGTLWATAVALKRWPAAGFLGAWFFIILAPSSSIVPLLTQTVAEHRMYLPLAAVVALVVLALHAAMRGRAAAGLVAVLVVLVALTARRNYDYRSGLAIWTDTVAKSPRNSRAHHNLGIELARLGRTDEAIDRFKDALDCKPTDMLAHFSLAHQLALDPRNRAAAIEHYEAALRITPTYVNAHINLANLLASDRAKLPDAVAHYEKAIQLQPDNSLAHLNLADTLAELPGRRADAIHHYQEAQRLNPADATVPFNFARALGNGPEAAERRLALYWQAIQLRPGFVDAEVKLANELAQMPNRMPEAIPHYEAALRLAPQHAQARYNLAVVYANLGRIAEAVQHLQIILQQDPGAAAARDTLRLLQAPQ
jgi:protein O-mannosyl-transferase